MSNNTQRLQKHKVIFMALRGTSIVQIAVYSFDKGYFGPVSAALDRVSGGFSGGLGRFRLGVLWSDRGTPKLNELFLELVRRIVGKQTLI